MATTEVFFPGVSDEESEIITALLSQLAFESFWNEEKGLRAYIDSEMFSRSELEDTLQVLGRTISFEVQNASPGEWDVSSADTFEPLVIASKIWLGRPSDVPALTTDYILRVDPQLAFGSGAHPSTLLCLEMMLEMDFKGKPVVDAGTGTAVLAALASMMGADKIVAFDNNPWALDVAKKTLEINNVCNVELLHRGVEEMKGKFEVVLANLNYSVFEHYFDSVARLVAENGVLLVSGIMLKNEADIQKMAQRRGFKIVKRLERGGWCAVLFDVFVK